MEPEMLSAVRAKFACSLEDSTNCTGVLAPKASANPGMYLSKVSVFIRLARLVSFSLSIKV